MLRLTGCLFLIGVFHNARAQTPNKIRLTDELCAGCVMANGAGYNDHPDCDKYIQCHDDGTGVLIGEIMNCAFGTHWNNEAMTCLPIGETPCNNDTCLNMTNDAVYSVTTNCRGYMKCIGGKSKPMCCSYNETYVDGVGCVDDVNDQCNSTCFGVSESKPKPKCDLFPVASNPSKYQQEVTGHGMLVSDCAPGTYFVRDKCGCVGFTVDKVKPVCKPEILLPFTKDHQNAISNGYYVQNINVDVKNGVAEFNGKDSRLIIPRFTNLEHSTTVVIKIKYSSNHETWTGMARALVSNSDCKNQPSIMISEDDANVYFGVGTDEAKFAYTFVPQLPVDPTMPKSEKMVEYKFDKGELTGTNGVDKAQTPANGYLRNVHCAIQIGHAENLKPFEGTIDEISIYLCDPDKP